MKTRTKALLLSLCAMMLVAASIFGTMAYLTSTDEVKNTFTVGNVKITLDEAKVGADGKALTGNQAERVKANSYKLMPGHTYDKDPTVTVKAGSEESYVRLVVTVTFDNKLTDNQLKTKLDSIFTGYSADWKRPDDPTVVTKQEMIHDSNGGTLREWTEITYVYYYYDTTNEKDTVSAQNADVKLPALFQGIQVPGSWTNADLAAIGGFEIKIVGQAIQADGFTNAAAAWTAFAE